MLEDLGLNLYSNSAAVLSEIIANAWDADAKVVDVDVDRRNRTLTITDNGTGMTIADLNKRYLTVGYKRRTRKETAKSPSGRTVMGRKGIGKLSIFSLANTVDVHTVRNGERTAFRMDVDDIRARFEKEEAYHPIEISFDQSLQHGTKIILSALKSGATIGEAYLRRRLSRRFSVIDGAHDFDVRVNKKSLTLEDRQYYKKFQYLWHCDDERAVALAGKTLEKSTSIPHQFTIGRKARKVSGWIASVKSRGQLKSQDDENLNRIVLMVRGKLAHENLLEELTEAGFYKSYLIGEIHADFLDVDDQRDIATSSRQRIIEDDTRYKRLKNWLFDQLKVIEAQWTDWRNETGTREALEIPAINAWYNRQSSDDQRRATALLGKVNSLNSEDGFQKQAFFKQAIVAFEIYKVKRNLDALENMSGDEILSMRSVFEGVEDIEATLYYEVVKQRVAVIDQLDKLVENNVREKFIQQHIYDHLWLIDPSWDRAATTSSMERSINRMIADVDAGMPTAVEKGRYDIKYRSASGRHVIIELKRPEVIVPLDKLKQQIRRYDQAMRSLLSKANRTDPYEFIVLVGREIPEWNRPGGRAVVETELALVNARVIHYEELITHAKDMYRDYLDVHEKESSLNAVLESIDESDLSGGKRLLVPGKAVRRRAINAGARKRATVKASKRKSPPGQRTRTRV